MSNYAEHFAMSKYASSADRSAAMLTELEHLALDLHTERAAFVALRDEIERLTAERDEFRDNSGRLLAVADSAVQHQREMVEAATEPLRAENARTNERWEKSHQIALAIQDDRDALRERVKVLEDALRGTVRELQACQSVIHLAGEFDPAYVSDAQVALKAARAALEETK